MTMELGNFSVSLAVKDIALSRAFYEKLGFTVWGGDQEQNWLILKNGTTVIGLFQGMFERNILTFNPVTLSGNGPFVQAPASCGGLIPKRGHRRSLVAQRSFHLYPEPSSQSDCRAGLF
jgi:hypothetical protein